jgi:pyrroloquinoline quinone (PQQ) biosynthesis protein C/mannose-6-phosphate isomerase-like protein (cupin superfamily)
MSLWISDSLPIIDPSAAAALSGSIRRVDESIPPSSRGMMRDHDMRRRSDGGLSPAAMLARLHTAQSEHPFWDNRLFRACAAGALARDDFRIFFSQYYLYTQSFTRYLAALMASCESDLHRSRLAENIWEEGGGSTPERRHAEIFRRFLTEGLGVDVDDIDFMDATRFFVREYLEFCLRAHPAAASAFLSLGTEGIVPRMYGVLVDGLLKAGVSEDHTAFFRIHMECDDEHAETLERMMVSYVKTPDWFNTCLRSMDYALTLRQRFFEQIYGAIEARRLQGIVGRIQRGESLAPDAPAEADVRYRVGAPATPLYENADDRLGVGFSVERVPFKTDVVDARVLRVDARRSSEKHKHPHESLLYVVSGKGRVHVNQSSLEVGPGDLVFVPRWAMHQSHSTGDDALTILAFTDFGLTEKAYVGNAMKTTRLRGAPSETRREDPHRER